MGAFINPFFVNYILGEDGITLCGKGIYARGLAQETLALAVSLAPSSQLIDLPKKPKPNSPILVISQLTKHE